VSLYKKFFPFVLAFTLAACIPQSAGTLIPFPTTPTSPPLPTSVATPSRPHYTPGELVDYIAQSGDSLPALAAHFNTTVDQIRTANPQIPSETTTMPPGMPMKIPIY
jgi:LysM repeat protein